MRRVPHWAELGESTFVTGIWLLWAVYRIAGRWPLRLLLYPVVMCYWAMRAQARHASLEYLHRLQAAHALPKQPLWVHSIRHFLAFADTVVDKALAYSGRYRFDRVQFAGRECVDALVARRQGAVIVTAHVGCLELCQALAQRQPGLGLTVLVHTRHAERFNRILRRLNPRCTLRLVQVTDFGPATAASLADRIAAGEFVAIAGDRVPMHSGRVARVPFLGVEAPFPVGAYLLASIAQCPLVVMTCARVSRGHEVAFELVASRVTMSRAGRDAQLTALASRVAARLETVVRRTPYEWFNFFPFWSQEAGVPAQVSVRSVRSVP
jgi:predicted LPLAT superfamily acyltransferase